jgi:hypothetical protein
MGIARCLLPLIFATAYLSRVFLQQFRPFSSTGMQIVPFQYTIYGVPRQLFDSDTLSGRNSSTGVMLVPLASCRQFDTAF